MDQEYFANKLASLSNGASKESELVEAFNRKLNSLSAYSEAKKAEQEANQNSWSSQLGLNPYSTEGQAVNLAASLASGTARVGGTLAAIPAYWAASMDSAQLTDRHYQAYQRYQQNQATPEDLLVLKSGTYDDDRKDNPTIQQSIEAAQLKRELGLDITKRFDVTDIVHQGDRKKLGEELKGGFDQPWEQVKSGWDSLKKGEDGKGWSDVASGLGDLLLHTGKSVVNNPQAATEYIVENVPQLALGAFGKVGQAALTTSNVGYAANEYQKGIEKFQKDNDGAMPSEEQRREMATYAASLALAEQVGDVSLLKGIGKLTGESAETAAKGFKAALKGAVKETTKAVGSEAMTEGYQTFAEGKANLEDVTAADIYTGAVIGGVAGGGMTAGAAGGATIAGVGSAYKAAISDAKAAMVDQAKSDASFNEVVQSGDVSRYLDKNSPDYSLNKAAQAFVALSQQENLTPEQRDGHMQQAQSVVTKLEDQLNFLKSQTAGDPQLQKDMAEAQAMIDNNPVGSAAHEAGKELLGIYQEEQAASAKMTDADRANTDKQIQLLESQTTTMRQIVDLFAQEANSTSTKLEEGQTVDSLVEAANADLSTADDGAKAQSAQAVRKLLSMALNGASTGNELTVDHAKALASNPKNGLTEQERKYLESYTEAQEAIDGAKNMAQVAKEVIAGDRNTDQKGLLDYRSRFSGFVGERNQSRAARELAGLSAFVASHSAKFAAMQEANKAYQASKVPQILAKQEDGSWSVTPAQGVPDYKQLRSEGKLVIGMNSGPMMQAVAAELKAMHATAGSLEAAFDLAFTPKTNAPVANVQNTTQANPTVAPVTQAPAGTGTTSALDAVTQTEGTVQEAATQPVAEPTAVESGVSTEGSGTAPVVESPRVKVKKAKLTPQKKELKQAERDYRKARRSNPVSLWSTIKHSLSEATLNEVFGSDWKKTRTMLKGKDGGVSLEQLAGQGTLDEFLPHNLRANDWDVRNPSEPYPDDQAAAYIAEKLRNRDYLTEETNLLLAQLDLTIQELQDNLSESAIDAEIARTEQSAEGTATAGETASTPSEESVGSVASAEGTETAGEGSGRIGGTGSAVSADTLTESTGPVLEALASERTQGTVMEGVRQSAGSEQGTQRPLAAVKNFVSQVLTQGRTLLDDYLVDGLNEKNIRSIRQFVAKTRDWGSVIASLVTRGDPRFDGKTPIQHLMVEVDGKWDFEENVKAAMVAAGLLWINDAVGKGLLNDDKSINSIKNRDSEESVSLEERELLGDVGVRYSVAANRIGQQIVQALGLKANKSVPRNVMPRLEAALGAYTLDLLASPQVGAIQTTEISNKDLNAGSMEGVNEKGYQTFVNVKHTKGLPDATTVQPLLDKMKGSSNALEKLLSVEVHSVPPSLDPIPFDQALAQNSQRQVPTALKEALEPKAQEKHYVRQAMWNLVQSMDESVMLSIMGSEDPTKAQFMQRKGIEAKNDALRREYYNLADFVEGTLVPGSEGLDTAFYFQPSVWKQQRVGLANNMVNPQTSKYHRHMVTKDAWRSTVDVNDKASFDNFKLRVLEGLGVKTDKQDNNASLAKWSEYLSRDDVKKAVLALRKGIQGIALSDTEQTHVKDAVKALKGKMHTLDALVALAEYTEAMKSGETTFQTELVGEIDGVTNGPMLTHILLGAGLNPETLFPLLNKGGFFELGHEHRNYNTFRGSPGVMDLYETVASGMVKAINAAMEASPKMKFKYDALWFFTGRLDTDEGKVSSDGRTFVKKPITALMYGSGMPSVMRGMGDEFVESVFNKIAGLDGTNVRGRKETQDLIKHLNVLLWSKDKSVPTLDTKMSAQELLEYRFSEKQVNQIREAFKQSLEKTIKESLKGSFGVLLETRDTLSTAANVSFEIYNQIYQELRNDFIQELVKKGEVQLNLVGKLEQDLTPAQEAEFAKVLKKLEPVMHTVMSLRGNELNAGISAVNRERKLSDNPLYTQELKLNGKIRNVNSQSDSFTDPGVSMLPFAVHSLDSGVSQPAAAKTGALNIHDAHVLGLGEFLQGGNNLNASLWDALLEYSPGREIFKMLSRTMEEAGRLGSDPVFAAAVTRAMETLERDDRLAEFGGLPNFLQAIADTAKQADKVRLGVLSQMGIQDQYAIEGGEYEVQEAQRAEAAKQLASLDSVYRLDGVLAQWNADAMTRDNEVSDQMQDRLDREAERILPATQEFLDGITDNEFFSLVSGLASSDATPQDVKESFQSMLSFLTQSVSKQDAVGMSTTPESQATVVQYLNAHRFATNSTAFGPLGASAIAHEMPVVAMMEQYAALSDDKRTAGALTVLLRGVLNDHKDFPQYGYYNTLLSVLREALPSSTKVVYVKTDTPVPSALPAIASRGWFDTGTETLYVLSPAFQSSGVTAEVLMHELLHAALQGALNRELSKPANQQGKWVQDLTAILEAARQHVQSKPELQGKFDAALQDVHELVSWGMTNSDFQAQVLNQIQVKPVFNDAAKAQKWFNGLKLFIKSLLAGLSHKPQVTSEGMVSGTAALIGNVSLALKAQTKRAKSLHGFAKNAGILSMASNPNTGSASDFTTQQVFDALSGGHTSIGFQARLNNVLNTVVNELHGPFGAIKAQAHAVHGTTALDAWAHAEAMGERPFAATVLGAPLAFSEKEQFVAEQVEAVMQAVLENKSPSSDMRYRELTKLYVQARTALKGQLSDDAYRFVFQPEAGANNKSAYLERFVALALSNERFYNLLDFSTQKAEFTFQGKSFLERLEVLWRASVDWLSSQMTGTYMGQQANKRMDKLVRDMITIEAKHKDHIQTGSVSNLFDGMDRFAVDGIQKGKRLVSKVAQSSFVKQNRFAVVKAVGVTATVMVNNQLGAIVNGVNTMRNQTFKDRQGTAIELMNYIKGPGAMMQRLVLEAKHIEKERLRATAMTANTVRSSFKDKGEYLTTNQKAALSGVLLRTGAFTLEEKYGTEGIRDMLESPAELNKAIAAEVAMLNGYPEVHYYIKQAKALAGFRVHGWSSVPNLNLNANKIAKLHGTGKPEPKHHSEASPVLERLISLYGLKEATNPKNGRGFDLAGLRDVLRTETQRQDGNGVKLMLMLHKHQYQEAKERLFKGSEDLMIHGYLPEEHNPHTVFEVVRDAQEEQALKEQGYSRVTEIPLDPADPDRRPAVMYVLRGGGLPRRQTGAFSYRENSAKGHSKHGGYYNPLDGLGVANMQSMNHIYNQKAANMASQFLPDPGFQPNAGTENFMVPLHNAKGDIMDYRYMMKESMRDDLLDRNNDFDHLLGVMAGSTLDKERSRDQNRKVVKAMREHFKAVAAQNPGNFVLVGEQSTDPKMKELWDLLPKHTQDDVKAIWGAPGMRVPYEMVTNLFGYPKASLSSVYDKAKRNFAEQLVVDMVDGTLKLYGYHRKGLRGADLTTYTKQGKVKLRMAEDMWGEVVSELKDFIVVKTGVVMAGNIASNMLQLKMNGLSLKEMFMYQKEALNAVLDYERDRTELDDLKLRVETGYEQGDLAELQGRIAELENSLARNPAKELIDAGLLPTMVEDVSMEDNPYSYKSQLAQWVEGKTSNWNRHVLNVGKTVYMTHDTLLYKTLSKTTQYSDFVARYALFKHLTENKAHPIGKDQAIHQAVEQFVNYDLALPKYLQYLDDHGFLMFTKYFLSIQRVIYRLVQEKPMHVLSTVALNNWALDVSSITDSEALFRIGNNPLSSGALGYPSAVTQAMTMQGGLSLLR